VKYLIKLCSESPDGSCVVGHQYVSGFPAETPITVSCKPHEKFIFTVTELDVVGQELEVKVGKATCMYVRREFRSLVSEFVDMAIYTMRKV
jgi:hypothetical protein